MVKVILISQFPLPYSKIGSWTTMYQNYFKSEHQIDFIICERTDNQFENVTYEMVQNDFLSELISKITHSPKRSYLRPLKKILQQGDNKYIIQIVDNSGIVGEINKMLIQMGLRDKCYIQYFYHGFAPIKKENFYGLIEETVLLTLDSYHYHIAQRNDFSCRASILYNGIDTTRFHIPDAALKNTLRAKFGYTDKKIFLWCAQDRPKKGLDLILDAWKRVCVNEELLLIVVGADRNETIDGVRFLGKIPNEILHEYYQAADCYLFPTLCHEGFGMSLIEALNCGCYCIASNRGGVAEVLRYGEFGTLIENSNFISEWVNAINAYLEGKINPITISNPVYSQTEWNLGMNAIIKEAKMNLQ